ncbi:MAG: hypothetical protein R6U85_06600, partial [Salinivirgaceae bacterium]
VVEGEEEHEQRVRARRQNAATLHRALLPGLLSHLGLAIEFKSSFRFSFVEMQELEYFSSVLSWFTLSQLHSLD